jgi:hypothetical protein
LSFRAGYGVGYDDGIHVEVRTEDDKPTPKEQLEKHWRLFVPPASAAVTTIFCVVAANRVGAHRTAAAAAAYAIAENTLVDYREKVVERFGEHTDEEIRAEVHQKRVEENQPSPEAIVVTGFGNQLCQEAYSGRYFLSDIETLRRAENDLNAGLIQHDTMTLDDWYHFVGLSSTSYSSDLGWTSDKIMKLQFSAVITEDGRPCIVFEYNYLRPLYGSFEG